MHFRSSQKEKTSIPLMDYVLNVVCCTFSNCEFVVMSVNLVMVDIVETVCTFFAPLLMIIVNPVCDYYFTLCINLPHNFMHFIFINIETLCVCYIIC